MFGYGAWDGSVMVQVMVGDGSDGSGTARHGTTRRGTTRRSTARTSRRTHQSKSVGCLAIGRIHGFTTRNDVYLLDATKDVSLKVSCGRHLGEFDALLSM